ncbi:hypothetical protein JMJ35_007314 [Cladonia borealis]|uniref:Uncharacterized protein n=1 Tax=Cladonia borealis TaxID=184061 RepID=A0AA39QVG7_9LECA|nr:hypothetical protein JMJ35_007314 [Cladonia borealis]
MHLFLSIFLSVSQAGFTHAQTWYYPDPNTVPTFNNIDVVNASWSIPDTSSSSTNLWLWCTPNGTVSYKLEFNVSVAFDGYRLVTLNYGSDLYCHFGVGNKWLGNTGTGNFHIEASDQPPVTWSPLPDPSPTTSTADPFIASSLGAHAASSAFASSTSSSSTSSLTTAATTVKTFIPSTSSLPTTISLVTLSPNVYMAPKSMNATTVYSSSLFSTLPSTSPQPASDVVSSRTLSTGAKAGIIVAAIAVVAISALNIFYFIRTRIKSSRLRSEPAQVTEEKKAETLWSSELQGPEFAVEKDCPGHAPKKELWELQ